MLRKILWLLSFLISTGLLFYFFTYPFSRFIFMPLCLVLAVTTFFSPAVGLALFILTTLTTLQIPIIFNHPYFSGPEPGFFAVCAAVSLHNLRSPTTIQLPKFLSLPLTMYTLAILASASLVWATLWKLPDPWTQILTLDALSKIYFWRWENPFHFLRISLLYLEGIAAFFVTLYTYQSNPKRTLTYTTLAFLAVGVLLMAYSAIDLLFRGKQLSVYPGFGPVFTDRNAYAALWVLYAPVAFIKAIDWKGIWRVVALLLAGLAWLFCGFSLSLSGIIAIGAASILAVVLARPKVLFDFFEVSFYRQHWVRLSASCLLALGLGVGIYGLFSNSELGGQVEERIGSLLGRGLFAGVFEQRALPWTAAAEMLKDHSLLGIGPGEFYKRFPAYRKRMTDLPPFEYERENAHNYFLQIAAETGVLGIASLLAVIAVMFQVGITSRLQPCASGLIGALAGLLVFSIAQQPMLRFEFQIYFWVFAALIVSPSLGGSSPANIKAKQKILVFSGLLVALLLAALLQSVFFPLSKPETLEYGFQDWQEVDGVRCRFTEAVAFLRSTSFSATVSLKLRNALEIPTQNVEVTINGKKIQLTLEGGKWEEIEENLPAGQPLELGIQAFPVVPAGFPDSWGKGILISEIK
ncbi:O-antigen ligase family protein [Acidobacteria bacterium AH-259-A15]|nr:O-antigen ligase family protein [Acidobacteria bacterium AH-259-A15]